MCFVSTGSARRQHGSLAEMGFCNNPWRVFATGMGNLCVLSCEAPVLLCSRWANGARPPAGTCKVRHSRLSAEQPNPPVHDQGSPAGGWHLARPDQVRSQAPGRSNFPGCPAARVATVGALDEMLVVSQDFADMPTQGRHASQASRARAAGLASIAFTAVRAEKTNLRKTSP